MTWDPHNALPPPTTGAVALLVMRATTSRFVGCWNASSIIAARIAPRPDANKTTRIGAFDRCIKTSSVAHWLYLYGDASFKWTCAIAS